MPLEWTISEDDKDLRLDKFLRRELPHVPLSHLHKLLRKRKVKVNGARAHGEDRLQVGDTLLLRGDPEQLMAGVPSGGAYVTDRRDYKVLYEDEFLLAVSKPAGLAVHPGTGLVGPTLVEQIRAALLPPELEAPSPESNGQAGDSLEEEPTGRGVARLAAKGFLPSPAHRLDRWTSGVVMIARKRQAMAALTEAFTSRTIHKQYLAIVKGAMPGERGEINLPLAEHQQSASSRKERGVNMQAAMTRWEQLSSTPKASLLKLRPGTGRTHQLRRHLASEGHPILGDRRYGDFPLNRIVRNQQGVRRHMLHAWKLELKHPITGQALSFCAPPPDDFLAALRAFKLRALLK